MHTDGERLTNAMDRLSDWVGSFVPGCAFLGPRHPLKVSIVMGGLGLLAGWLAIVPFALMQGMNMSLPIEWAIPGTLLGLVVFLPLLAWQGRSPGVIFIGLLLAIGAGSLHTLMFPAATHDSETIVEGLTIGGTIAGVIYAIAGIIINDRRKWWMPFPIMVVSGLLLGCFALLMSSTETMTVGISYWFHLVVSMALAANLFSGVYAALAITLGSALWDRTPKGKFEGIADGAGGESEL